MIGLGAYQGARVNLLGTALTSIKLWLVHLNPAVAVAVRTANPLALIGLRADPGDDNHQVDVAGDPATEARRFADTRIIPALASVPTGTYSFAVGINEDWPAKDPVALRWRAAFELALCRIVQNERGLRYAWGAIPVGNLEASEVALFAGVFREAWATNYHAYLGPGRTDLSQETDAYYARRPAQIWLPELRTLGIRLRLLAGECGTYSAPNTYPDFDATREAAVAVAINRLYGTLTANGDFEFVGGCAFGVGTVGTMAAWDLTPALSTLADAADSDPQPRPQPGVTHVANVGQGFQKCIPLIGEFQQDQGYDWPGTPNEVGFAVAVNGYATWDPRTNETMAHHVNGAIWADGGNHGDGSGKMGAIRPPFR